MSLGNDVGLRTADAPATSVAVMAERPEAKPLIEMRDVRKAFGGEVALAGVDLSVQSGKVTALLGPSGAGKTTLVRILAGLLKPDSGSMAYDGIDGSRKPPSLSSGLSGQFTAIDDLLTGRENLELVARLHHLGRQEARREAAAAIERFGLEEVADHRTMTYSGGLLRRLDIALGLIASPSLLVLDEPTTGLDPRSRIDLWALIEELVADGCTVLLTTQYLEEADRLGHRIVVLERGRVIAEGPAAELKARIGGDSIELHVRSREDCERARAELAPSHPRLQVDPTRLLLRLPTEAGASDLLETLLRLAGAAVEIEDIAVRRPSLDDVFLALTGHSVTPGGAEARR